MVFKKKALFSLCFIKIMIVFNTTRQWHPICLVNKQMFIIYLDYMTNKRMIYTSNESLLLFIKYFSNIMTEESPSATVYYNHIFDSRKGSEPNLPPNMNGCSKQVTRYSPGYSSSNEQQSNIANLSQTTPNTTFVTTHDHLQDTVTISPHTQTTTHIKLDKNNKRKEVTAP